MMKMMIRQWMVLIQGTSAGEELWGREQTGAGEKNPVGQEAGTAAQAGCSLVSKQACSMED